MAIQNISNLAISASFQNLLQVSGSIIGTATGSQVDSLTITASHALQADNAATATTANSATTALSASHAVQADNAATADFATSASYAANAVATDTGSLLQTASISNATITFEKGDASTFALTVNNVVSASHAVQADSALAADTATSASYALSATSASRADSAALADLATLATNATYADNTIVIGKNVSGGVIEKGTPLYFTGSGTSGNLVGVWPADASNPARMPAAGIAGEQLTAGAEGVVLLDGYLGGVDTTGFASGDAVYVAVGGGYTNTRPTGSSVLVQALGYIEKVGSNGSGVIQGSGRANDVPNIAQGHVFVGGTGDVSTTVATSSLSVATASLALGVATGIDLNVSSISASSANFVSASIGYLQTVTGSATIIGDEFIILNADSPTARYAGIKVYDSGSLQTGSLLYDSVDDHWEYESTAEGYAAGFISGPTGSIGGTTNWPSKDSVLKGLGSNHIGDSNITDNGSKVAINSNSEVTGSLTVTGTITGTLSGNASTATSASHAVQADNATSASYASTANALTAGDKTLSGYIQQDITAPGTNAEKAFVNVSNASVNGKAYNRVYFGIADYPSYGAGFEDYFAIEYYDGFGFNYGSEFNVNGKNALMSSTPSGSGFADRAYIQTADQYNGTSLAKIEGNAVQIGTANNTDGISIGRTGNSTTISGSVSVEGTISGTITNATSASIADYEKNLNTNSGSIQLWQGSKAEYDAISGSASNNVLYFVIGS